MELFRVSTITQRLPFPAEGWNPQSEYPDRISFKPRSRERGPKVRAQGSGLGLGLGLAQGHSVCSLACGKEVSGLASPSNCWRGLPGAFGGKGVVSPQGGPQGQAAGLQPQPLRPSHHHT